MKRYQAILLIILTFSAFIVSAYAIKKIGDGARAHYGTNVTTNAERKIADLY